MKILTMKRSGKQVATKAQGAKNHPNCKELDHNINNHTQISKAVIFISIFIRILSFFPFKDFYAAPGQRRT